MSKLTTTGDYQEMQEIIQGKSRRYFITGLESPGAETHHRFCDPGLSECFLLGFIESRAILSQPRYRVEDKVPYLFHSEYIIYYTVKTYKGFGLALPERFQRCYKSPTTE